MKYSFKELVDIPKLQELTDELYNVSSIASAIISMDGEILSGSGWQRICTDFHRLHPQILKECIESDIKIRKQLDEGKPFAIYKCPRGLVDASSPVIIEGEQVANIFSGQVFLEPPDATTEQFFRTQAQKFGFDETEYIKAFREIPVFTEKKFRFAISFLAQLAQLIANMGLTRLNELESIKKLRDSESKLRSYIYNAPSGIFVVDRHGFYLEANKAAEEITGYSNSELLKMNLMDIIATDDYQKAETHFKTVVQSGESVGELSYIKKDGSRNYWSIKAVKISEDSFLEFTNDITDRKSAEEALLKSAKELSIKNRIADIFLTTDNEEMYGEVLNVVLGAMESPYGTFAYINENGDRIVPSMTRDIWDECKMPDRGIFFPRETWNDTLWGKCLIEKKSFSTNGPFTFPDGHMPIARALATPIIHKGESIGNFMVGNKSTDYSEQDIALLEAIADHVAPILASRLLNERYEVEQKQIQSKVLKNQYYLTKAQEIGKIGTWELDVQKNILIWTDENYKIFGVPLGTELNYEIFLNCIHPDDRDYVHQKWSSALNNEPYDIMHRLIVNNKVKWVREKADIEFDKAGKPVMAIGFTQDLTDLKQIEDALEESEKNFKTMFEQAPLSYQSLDEDGNFKVVNQTWLNVLGYSREEVIGKFFGDFLHPDWKDHFKENFPRFKAIGEVLGVEFEMIKKDGSLILVSFHGKISKDKNGNFQQTHCIFQDITKRNQMEEALIESEQKYQTIMESMKEPLYIGSQDCIIKYMNPAMIKRTGHDATGESCFKAIHDLDKKCPWCHYEDVMDGNTHELDVVSPRDNHSFHISITPIVNNDGSISSLNVLRDVTEFKKMESQLQQSQKMESIGTLAGGIAHDFNNILFPIVGHTEMLLEDVSEDSPFKESLNEIYISALRAKDLVKQILTFSRQDSNELKLMKMQPIIKEALKLIRSTIPTTIEIKQNIKPDCGVIKADPTQIHQIIMNITTNAYHAMEKTGGELKISLKEIEVGALDLISPDMKPGAYACLTIADKGIGMDKGLVQKIFDPFFTTKEKGKGTGMGLSVVHGIIKNMNGSIQVYSEPGKGTQFHVYLPVQKSFSEEQITNSEAIIHAGTEQILLVDDEKAILTMEKMMLERLGYKVSSQTSSTEALKAFRDSPDKFDLIITDMAMPNMPGDKLVAELTKIRPDIPILLCTRFSETMSEEKAVSLGIKGFLLKPIVIKDLSQKIREVLDKNQLSRIDQTGWNPQ